MTGPVYDRHGVQVHHGDCLDVMRSLPDVSVHAIVTDPPAGIRFMGRAWDSDMGGRHSWVAWLSERMREAHRVLKPGGYGLVWALPRTSHWTAWALEDAGFEVRDCVVHLFGSGFPKSLDVSKAIDKAAGAEREVVGTVAARMPQAQAKGWGNPGVDTFRDARVGTHEMAVTTPATVAARQWDGWGTALKPAAEHWWLIRKPMPGAAAATVLEHGTGALNIGGCRTGPGAPVGGGGNGAANVGGIMGPKTGIRSKVEPHDRGRWPANLVLTHAARCDDDGCQPEWCPVAELDAQSGTLTSGANPTRRGSDKFRDAYGEFAGQAECTPMRGADQGGASRFFPQFRWEAKAPTSERPMVDGKSHETVKPLGLMRWMVRLVCAPGGTVLDCFAGSGTTGQAARAEGMKAVLIEQDVEHIDKIRARLDARPKTTAAETKTAVAEPLDLLDLLDGTAS